VSLTSSTWQTSDLSPVRMNPSLLISTVISRFIDLQQCSTVRPMAHDPSSPSKFLVPDKYGTRMQDRLAKLLVQDSSSGVKRGQNLKAKARATRQRLISGSWGLGQSQNNYETTKPSYRWQTRATRKHAKIVPIRRAYNVVADNTGLSSFV